MSFHYLLMANQAIYQKKLLEGLSGTGLTIGQPKILDYLKDNNGANQKDIAKGCCIEAGSLTSILNGMEAKGLIERRRGNGDKRSYYIFLTDKGKELQAKIIEEFIKLEDLSFKGISKEKRDEFIETFKIIYNNIILEKEATKNE